MGRSFRQPFPSQARQMQALGDRMRAARLRRDLTAVDFARRVGVSRDTLSRLEGGDDSIALGTYVRALRVLGLDGDLEALARDDELGRKLQDLRLPMKRSRTSPATKTPPPVSS